MSCSVKALEAIFYETDEGRKPRRNWLALGSPVNGHYNGDGDEELLVKLYTVV